MVSTDPFVDGTSPAHLPSITLASGEGVLLVGENSAGSDPSKHVTAPLVDVKSLTSGDIEGRYAWWVGDEGVKANMAATVEELPSAASGAIDRLKFLASSPNRGFPTLGAPWNQWLPDNSGTIKANTSGKLATRRQIVLADSGLVDEEKLRFHDFTVSSAGVLADTKHGGLKKDLSIAFELPDPLFRNSEFTRVLSEGEPLNPQGLRDPNLAYATNHGNRMAPGPMNGRSTKTAVNFRDPSWSTGFYFRGPTFDQLRDHYQLYRRVENPFSGSARIRAQAFLPNASVTAGSQIRARAPFGDYIQYPTRGGNPYFNAGGSSPGASNYEVTDSYGGSPRIRPMATELVPELVRYMYTLAIQSYPETDPAFPDQYNLRLITTPFMILHNPYNVELRSSAMWYRIQRSELQARFTYIDPITNGVVNTQKPNASHNADINLEFLIDQKYGIATRTEKDELAYDAIDFFASDNGRPTGTITMAPGEFKIFTAAGSAPIEGGQLFGRNENRNIFLQTKLTNLFSTGIYMDVVNRTNWSSSEPFRIPRGTRFTTEINAKPPWGGNSGATFPHLAWPANEYHTILSKIVSPGVSDPVPKGANYSWDQIRILGCMQDQWWTGKPTLITGESGVGFKGQLLPEDIESVNPAGPRRYIGRIDMYQKPLYDGVNRDSNISLTTHNPRGMVQTMSMTGAQGPASVRGPATWTGSVMALDPANSSSPGFDNRFWGTGTRIADGGQSTLMLYDIPRAPITSLASLQHANVSRLGVSSAFAIGNSYASPYVPSNSAWWRSSIVPNKSNNGDYWIMDNSYLFNEDLFDSYYFSGVNPGSSSTAWNNQLSASSVSLGAGDPTNTGPLQDTIDQWKEGTGNLLNPRMQFQIPSGLSFIDADKDLDLAGSYSGIQSSLVTKSDLRPHNTIAAYALNQGAFNINSVSVVAWRAQLAGLRGAAVDHYVSPASTSSSSSNSDTPFPGSSMPGAGSSTGSDSELWNGFRSLSDNQIEDLAKEIVAQIKGRARSQPGSNPRPFTTMGEFVNRRLGNSNNPFSRKGALQTALDQSVNKNPGSLSTQPVLHADTNYRSVRQGGTEANTVDFANPEALAEYTIAGTPQWMTQADLLERIGPELAARSDTFTVRTYGETLDKDGNVTARAWLEATVQRGTGYVNPSDHPGIPVSSPTLSAVNKTYGRRFSVVSLRWLTPEDI